MENTTPFKIHTRGFFHLGGKVSRGALSCVTITVR